MPRYTTPEAELYRELSPAQIATFAKASGFTGEEVYETSTILETLDGAWIDVPTRTDFADYHTRIAAALYTLSTATGIPTPGLLHKISPEVFPVARIHKLIGLP